MIKITLLIRPANGLPFQGETKTYALKIIWTKLEIEFFRATITLYEGLRLHRLIRTTSGLLNKIINFKRPKNLLKVKNLQINN